MTNVILKFPVFSLFFMISILLLLYLYILSSFEFIDEHSFDWLLTYRTMNEKQNNPMYVKENIFESDVNKLN